MFRRFIGVFLVATVPTAAAADFNRGVELYQAGDVAAAAEEWKSDAEAGNIVAAWLLGNLYTQGNGVPRSERIAFNYYMQAAQAGHPESQVRVGITFRDGSTEADIEPNYTVALNWFEKAALQRNAEAQYYLGVMHRDGIGVTRDRSEGLRWLLLSAKKEYIQAYLTLADLYLKGDSVAENRTKAAIYLGLAQNRFTGKEPASVTDQFDRISRRLKPDEIAAGRSAAKELAAAGHTLPAADSH